MHKQTTEKPNQMCWSFNACIKYENEWNKINQSKIGMFTLAQDMTNEKNDDVAYLKHDK